MMKFKPGLSILLLLSGICAFGQHPWTLSECIEYANAHNIQIRRTELQADAAREDLLQAKMNLLPDLNAGFGRTYSFGRQVNPGTNEYTENNFIYDSYAVTSNLVLFNGLRNYHRIRQNQFRTLAAIQQVEVEKMEKTLSIVAAFLQILYQKEMVAMTRAQLEATQFQTDRTRTLVGAGKIAEGGLLELLAQLANEKLNVTKEENQLKLSFLNLVQLLDLDSVAGFEIFSPEPLDSENQQAIPAVNVVYADALEFFPHIRMAEYQLQAEKMNLKMQHGRLSPQLVLSGSFYTLYSDYYGTNGADYPYGDQFRDNLAQSAEIGLSVPIFNRGEVSRDISLARISLEDSKYLLEQTKQVLFKEIQQACNDAGLAREKFKAAEEAVSSSRESFSYTEESYNLGVVGSVEYSLAKNNLIRAESQLLQARYEVIFAWMILNFYRGKSIEL
ncbi:MAG: TolC family protein [Bacteroidales bacterium]|nr:TolC family protein [Bacteroidales bacterium]